jgi:GDPmannose 4,6-dehydratase
MLQADKPDSWVLATGHTISVRDFVTMAAEAAGFDLVWRGHGVDEIGLDRHTGRTLVRVNPRFYRPAEVDLLIGDASKAARDLGWQPTTPISELCARMVATDLRRVESGNAF